MLGGTWAVGALSAWEQTTGLRAKDVDILVGTSAGSVLASLVACGVSTDELIASLPGRASLNGASRGVPMGSGSSHRWT